jgi:hypothetical protein
MPGTLSKEHEPVAAVRVIPLIEQRAATGTAGRGNGRHGSATRAAVRETHAGETIPAAE